MSFTKVTGSYLNDLGLLYSGGFVNKLRNNVMLVAQRGTSGTITAGTPAYALDGWILSATGANITWSRSPGSIAPYFMTITGATSNTDITLTQRIESSDAFALAGQTVTLQFILGQSNGSTLTPTLTTKYAGSTDNWTSPVTDINAVSMTACPSGINTTVAYTFTVSANAINGYEIIIDLGAMNSNAKSLNITSFDLRVTSGISTGINSNPPPIEIKSSVLDFAQCQRYYAVLNNIIGFAATSTTIDLAVNFPAPMRVAPTVSLAGPINYQNGQGDNQQQSSASLSGATITASTQSMTIFALGNYSGLTAGRPGIISFYGANGIIVSAEL